MPCAPASPVRTAVTTKSAAHRRGDVGLRAVDRRSRRRRASAVVRMPATSEPPSGSVIASEPISSPSSVGRTHRSIWSGSPAATMCGSEMPEVNSAGEHAAGRARVVHLLGEHERVDRVAAPAADRSSGRTARAARARRPARCSSRGSSPARSHSSRCGSTSALTKRRPSRAARAAPGWRTGQLTAAPPGCRRRASAATRRPPWPAGRAGRWRRRPRRAALDDEVQRAQVGQHVPRDRQVRGLGQQPPELVRRSGSDASQAHASSAAGPHPDVRRAALVAAARARRRGPAAPDGSGRRD